MLFVFSRVKSNAAVCLCVWTSEIDDEKNATLKDRAKFVCPSSSSKHLFAESPRFYYPAVGGKKRQQHVQKFQSFKQNAADKNME